MPAIGLKTTNGENVTREEISNLDHAVVENLFDAPYPLVIATLGEKRTPYEDHQVALTSLCGDMPPTILKRRHDWFETVDDSLWRLMGTGMHRVLEGADPARSEQSVVATVDGIEVRSRRDYYTKDCRILDWKLTSAWTGLDMQKAGTNWPQVKPEYADQLALSAALEVLAHGTEPTGAAVVLVYRDWTPGQAKRYRNWPQRKRQTYVYPKDGWDLGLFDRTLVKTVHEFRACMGVEDKHLPPCLDTWRPDKKTGLPTRCLSYCPVNEHCSQFAAAKRQVRAPLGS